MNYNKESNTFIYMGNYNYLLILYIKVLINKLISNGNCLKLKDISIRNINP